MSGVTLMSSSRAEWIKFRSVRSTLYGIITMFVLSVGLGSVIDILIGNHYNQEPPLRRATFDPVTVSLVGIFFAQFVVGVLGAMFITNEYTTASIRTTLAAVPRRTLLVMSKVLVMTVALVLVCESIVFLSFLIGQAILSGHTPTVSLGTPGALRAVIFAGLYLVLLGGMGFGLGLFLRKTPPAIIVFVVILLIVPILAQFLPSDWSGPILRFLPSQLGGGMMSINQAPGSYPPVGCAAILFAYVATLIGVGTYVMNQRDA